MKHTSCHYGYDARDALAHGSVKDAAAEVAAALNLPRKEVYRMALQLAERE